MWVGLTWRAHWHNYTLLPCCRFEKGGHGRGVIQKQPVLSGTTFSLTETVLWFEGLMAALDCYNWVLGDQLMSPSELFKGNGLQSIIPLPIGPHTKFFDMYVNGVSKKEVHVKTTVSLPSDRFSCMLRFLHFCYFKVIKCVCLTHALLFEWVWVPTYDRSLQHAKLAKAGS